jgi:hypothetical protein
MDTSHSLPRRVLIRVGTTAAIGLAVSFSAISIAQVPVSYDAAAIDSAKPIAMVQLVQLRDSFVKATAASGLTCAIDPPKLVIEDVPSYGSYDPDTNTLRSSLWELLKPEERGIFFRMADAAAKKHGSGEAAARHEFEIGVHHWVFVHELGHWWQACRKVNDNRKPYQFEYEADRIAAAYWNENDPSIARHMDEGFKSIVAHMPNPLPPGQEKASYFNEHYEQLGPTPAYIWFQSQMCVDAFAEKPVPSFLQTLRETGHP